MRKLGRWLWAGVLFLPHLIGSVVRSVPTALVQIWANKIRALLTVLGIIIAVTSIITVVSLVEGFGNYVTNFLRGLGTNMMIVYPEWVRGPRGEFLRRAEMDIDDIHAVDAGAPAIRRTSPLVWSSATIEYGRQQVTNVQLRGTNEAFQPIRNFYVDAGRFFGAVDVENGSAVCVLGREILRKLECDESIVGDYVHLDGQRFQVIGLLESKGSFMGENQDETIIIPWTMAVKLNPYARTHLAFYVEAMSEPQIPDAEGQLVRILRQRHGIKPGEANDFGAFKQDQILQQFNQVRVIATSVLAGIVSISLLVGGIGIMNVMLVSVTERTREIGLRKSVGARRRDILTQFLTEAVVLSTVGGAIGIALGYGFTHLASLHPDMVEVTVPLWSVLLALGFSAAVGIFFGIIPAFKAAIIHPIDALRHE
ncbi:MAG TPA: ABC transporter permease [Phycisphaerae bacterium]|nr:ABC transporter permease [Phycisphaerae bacterium]HNU45983.1 ABC transporter permease [Phycisphaerae bacterium]